MEAFRERPEGHDGMGVPPAQLGEVDLFPHTLCVEELLIPLLAWPTPDGVIRFGADRPRRIVLNRFCDALNAGG